jgi:hypothetical protein
LRDRPLGGQPQESAISASEFDLRDEKIMVCRKAKRIREGDIKVNFLPCECPITTGRLIGLWMNTARLNRIICGKSGIQNRSDKTEIAGRGRALLECHVRR